jgi:hypothetical protein
MGWLWLFAAKCGSASLLPHLFQATWRSGDAAVCKTVYPGSIPGVASNTWPNAKFVR